MELNYKELFIWLAILFVAFILFLFGAIVAYLAAACNQWLYAAGGVALMAAASCLVRWRYRRVSAC